MQSQGSTIFIYVSHIITVAHLFLIVNGWAHYKPPVKVLYMAMQLEMLSHYIIIELFPWA